jgi:lipopolysaccharide/colanic/teichoic acid biosynthesis glycosyltransferase
MHILLIHQAFVSPNEGGGTRHYEFAQHCREKGQELVIVASSLNYLTGKPLHDCRGLFTRQQVDGLTVLRAYTFPTLHHSFVWRIISFLSFMVTSAWAGLRAGPIDVVMGTSPPIFQAVSAWLVATLRRRPFLLEIRDLWPEFAIDIGVLTNPVFIFLSRRLESFLYAKATHILVNSPAYRDYILRKRVPANKISLIPNGVDPDMFNSNALGKMIRRELKLDDQFVVTYAGALGMANDIPTILRAANRLRSRPDIHFLLVGDGKERCKMEALAHQMKLPNVTFTGSFPKSQMPEILAASDACIAILKDIPIFRTTYPNKVFDYMAAGRPTILAIDGVIREVVEAAGGGIFVPPGDDAALADAVQTLVQDHQRARTMGKAARIYVVEHFNRHKQAVEFEELINHLAIKKINKFSINFRYSAIKRLIDLVIAIPLLIFISPVLALVGLLVRVKLGSPILFRQQRPGLYGKPFTFYKLRTMTDARADQGNLLTDADRLTPLGRFLRSTSLDELPELFNVLKGDMSLVGPRPLLMQYITRYSPEQMRRHEVKPGMTGWAQVNGRNALTWEQKFALDVWYVDHQSLWLDLKILAMTIWKILKREGISQPGQATAEEFKGF